jgi:hypothetical protein
MQEKHQRGNHLFGKNFTLRAFFARTEYKVIHNIHRVINRKTGFIKTLGETYSHFCKTLADKIVYWGRTFPLYKSVYL